jgi:alpha-galactosidase
MTEETKSILLNKDIIAIDQDPLGKQAFRVLRNDGIEAWKKPLSGDRIAVAFLNRNSKEGSVTVSLGQLEIDPKSEYKVYDVWKHEMINHPAGALTARMKSHECQVFVLTPL